MKTVTTTTPFDYMLSPTEAVKMIAEAGFSGIDLSLSSFYGGECKQLLLNVKAEAERYCIPFVQAHGPIGKLVWSDKAGIKAYYEKCMRSIDICLELNIPNLILHPTRFSLGDHEAQIYMNTELFFPILCRVKDTGVRIALENMCGTKTDLNGNTVEHVCKTPSEHAKYVDEFNLAVAAAEKAPAAVACLDTGHAFCSGQDPANFARVLGKERLQALHVHDNDGTGDAHTLPYLGKTDWKAFKASLSDIDYTGDITLEAVNFTAHMPKEMLPTALRLMQSCAESLIPNKTI